MPQYPELFTELHQPLNYMIYQVLSPGWHQTPFVRVDEFHRMFAHWYVGNMGPGSWMYVTLEEAQDAAGTAMQWLPWYIDIADSALGQQMTHHALEIRNERFTQGYDYLALTIYVYVNPVEFTSWIWGICPRMAAVTTTFWDQVATV